VITSASTLETVIAGFGATIRDLTIQNTRQRQGATHTPSISCRRLGLHPRSSSQLRLSRVELIASGAGQNTFCVRENYALQPIVRIVDSTCLSTGSQAYGIFV